MTKQLMAEVDVGRYMFVDQQAKKRKISKRMFLEHMIDVYKDMIESRDLDLAYENM